MKLLKRLFQEEEGVTLIEYGLIAALIAIAAIAVLTATGTQIVARFQQVVTALTP